MESDENYDIVVNNKKKEKRDSSGLTETVQIWSLDGSTLILRQICR